MPNVLKDGDNKGREVAPYRLSREFILTGDLSVEEKKSSDDFVDNYAEDEGLDGSDEQDVDVSAMKAEALEILENAKAEAERILAEAREQAEQVRDIAYKEGLNEGKKEGRRAGTLEATEEVNAEFEARLGAHSLRVAEELRMISEEKERILELYIDDLRNIALAIGEKIVHASLRSSSEVTGRMILAATEKMKRVAWAKIYIGRTDENVDIQSDAGFIKSVSKIAESVKLVMIDETEPGTCIIETPDAIMDISVKTQIENIKEILNNARQ